MGLWLRLPAIEPFTWQAGQYVDVMLPGERRRSFSLANPPHDASLLELHVRRAPGGAFSEQVFNGMKEGSLLRIEGPLGQFVYKDGDRPLLAIGGGTGYAPLKAILRQVLETGSRREISLYWGARTAEDLYEDEWLRALAARHPQFRYAGVTSGAGARSGDPRSDEPRRVRHLCRRPAGDDRCRAPRTAAPGRGPRANLLRLLRLGAGVRPA
jgi:CDP-4-dehydro-6-deoxyglucose reductase